MKKFLFASLILLTLSLHVFAAAPGSVLLIVGTRPEAIKMIPLYQKLKEEHIPALLCSTGQHTELLEDVLKIFDVKPDYELNIMKPGQDLFHITETVLEKTKILFEKIKPSLVLVQGDTTSAMAAALAAFYLNIPVGHVEAGLRTGNMRAPFPEEMNRRFIGLIATYHFAPTSLAASNLKKEGIGPDSLFLTGNTVIDALHLIKARIREGSLKPTPLLVETIEKEKKLNHKILLLTAHRRESFEGGLLQIFTAVNKAVKEYPNLFVIYPKHPNPAIQKVIVESEIDKNPNVLIVPALSYQDMVYVLDSVDAVATDSGGVQEEAVSLNKPVLVLRNETDRSEGVQNGGAILVGTQEAKIYEELGKIMNETAKRNSDSSGIYGDGQASQKIADVIKKHLQKEPLK